MAPASRRDRSATARPRPSRPSVIKYEMSAPESVSTGGWAARRLLFWNVPYSVAPRRLSSFGSGLLPVLPWSIPCGAGRVEIDDPAHRAGCSRRSSVRAPKGQPVRSDDIVQAAQRLALPLCHEPNASGARSRPWPEGLRMHLARCDVGRSGWFARFRGARENERDRR